MSPLGVQDVQLPPSPNLAIAFAGATLYVFSGSMQPLIMTVVKESGLGDPSCQIYMLFYYIGPALVSVFLCKPSPSPSPPPSPSSSVSYISSNSNNKTSRWPTREILIKSAGISSIDIIAQAMNYTGSSLCGPTIFAIIYSSVTIWTAIYSRMILARVLNRTQWIGVFVVFSGLAITAWDSVALGESVLRGAVLVFLGSSLHAMTYVLLEAIMTKTDNGDEELDVITNCAIQGIFASLAFLLWQCVYTLPRFQDLVIVPAQQAGTSLRAAIFILSAFGGSNLVHALTFFYTLKNFPGGAASAGIMKGLQAVLVFLFTSLVYCGRRGGGEEMCFTRIKLVSLVVVLGGVMIFAIGTDKGRQQSIRTRRDYAPIGVEDHNLSLSPVPS